MRLLVVYGVPVAALIAVANAKLDRGYLLAAVAGAAIWMVVAALVMRKG